MISAEFSGITWGRVGCPPPETFDREISADLLGKERQGKVENGAEKKEN